MVIFSYGCSTPLTESVTPNQGVLCEMCKWSVGHLYMTSAEGAGGNNKSVAIVQPGNWLTEHKHTLWIIIQCHKELMHINARVCMISRGITPQTNCPSDCIVI